MDDDDEFGDLYTDVLLASAPPPQLKSPAAPAAVSDDDDDQVLYGSSCQGLNRPPTPAPAAAEDDDWMLGPVPTAVDRPVNWGEDEDDEIPLPKNETPDPAASAEVKTREARVSEPLDAGIAAMEEDKERFKIGGLDQETVIPGLSAGPSGGFENGGAAKSDDWDSDSEDDLQIVLNDDANGRLGGEMRGGIGQDDDEDGDEDLVIVTDEDRQHHQRMEDQEWGEEGAQAGADGEKEGLDGAKANGAVGGVAPGARIGYSNHGFHPQHHSMYKYVRPGLAPAAGGPMAASISAPGQARPPLNIAPAAGRGKGDWRPIAGRGVSAALKSFLPGYGTRTFGIGLDFTLPSHKTVFDVDIDSFEEKPWTYPGVDISDFFNFGLDEEIWKNYCKQLDQFRLEATMQSKIRVYESGRPGLDYDPDLPPELAAATGLHDVSAENMQRGKADGGAVDPTGQGRGGISFRLPIPIGRPIQVEGGYGERLPSIDTRPPRMRDPDTIIEIVCHDSGDDLNTYNGALEQSEHVPPQEHLKRVHEVVDDYPEYSDRCTHNYSDKKREMVSRKTTFTPERDGVLPVSSEATLQIQAQSRYQGSPYASGPSTSDHGGRLPSGRKRHSGTSIDQMKVVSRGALGDQDGDKQEGNLGGSPHSHQPDVSPAVTDETTGEPSVEQRDDEHEGLALGGSIELEGEEMASDSQVSRGTPDDDSSIHFANKQKLSSRVEQPANNDNGNGGSDDLMAIQGDNGREKSRDGREYHKRHEDGDEIVQDGHPRRISDLRKRHEEEERNYRRKDDYVRDSRQEVERSRVAPRGRVDTHHSYPHRDLDAYPSRPVRGRSEGFEPLKDRDSSGIRQRREDNIHGRRIRDEVTRREHDIEARTSLRSKGRLSDAKDKDEDLHLRRRADDGDWRNRDREGVPRHRERDDGLLNRRDNLEDPHTKRRKVEEHSRREKVDREDLPGYRAREDVVMRRRERDEGNDHRRKEDASRARDKSEDLHSARHKDESFRQKEREDRHWLKQPHEDAGKHRQREEERAAARRNGRAKEDRSVGRNTKAKHELRAGSSEKDSQPKDGRQHNEQPSRRDRSGEESNLQHRGLEDILSRENQSNIGGRSARHERSSMFKNGVSHGQQTDRENSRKSLGAEAREQHSHGPGGKINDDQNTHSTHRIDKVTSKGTDEHETNNTSGLLSKLGEDQPEVPQLHHSSSEHGEDPGSDDESSRRGRSKFERWTSHKERDFSAIENTESSLSRMEVEAPKTDVPKLEELSKIEGNNAGDSHCKDADASKCGEDHDRHLETVAKLKRRSERFKLPMPGEKETPATKKVEGEVQLGLNETAADTEIKHERPPRKRRWTGN